MSKAQGKFDFSALYCHIHELGTCLYPKKWLKIWLLSHHPGFFWVIWPIQYSVK